MLTTLAKYAIKLTPDFAATAIASALATRTQRTSIASHEEEAMRGATRFSFGPENQHAAWSWGSGPIVVLVHGWGGRAAQMAPLATHIAAQGFRAVAFDVTGHGDSPESHTRWELFLRDIAALAGRLNEKIYAYIGHSAGGLAMMAARKLRGIKAQRYICICAPSHPFPPIRAIQNKLNPRPSVMERYKDYIAKQFETDWPTLQSGCAYANAGADLLLCYDEKDRFVEHREGDKILQLCPGARLSKTSTFGHVRILSAPEVMNGVSDFLLSGRESLRVA